MPIRLKKLKQRLGSLGYRVEQPKRGSHWKVYGPGGVMYPIPAHNGLKTEIGDAYLRGSRGRSASTSMI